MQPRPGAPIEITPGEGGWPRVSCPECGGIGVDMKPNAAKQENCPLCHGAGRVSDILAGQRQRLETTE